MYEPLVSVHTTEQDYQDTSVSRRKWAKLLHFNGAN